jgi:hypothetical protein
VQLPEHKRDYTLSIDASHYTWGAGRLRGLRGQGLCWRRQADAVDAGHDLSLPISLSAQPPALAVALDLDLLDAFQSRRRVVPAINSTLW